MMILMRIEALVGWNVRVSGWPSGTWVDEALRVVLIILHFEVGGQEE